MPTLTTPKSITGYTVQELGADLVAMEESLPHGGKALLEFCTETLPTADELVNFHIGLLEAGFHTSTPTAEIISGIPTTTLVLQKGSPIWMALIGVLPLAIIGGLITFGITRLEAITKALIPILLIGFGGIVLLAGILARPAERVAAAYLPAGR
jgi:hypothetical protein